MTYESEVLADSPLAYWRLGDSSGTTMVDSSGNSRDGSYVGTPLLGQPGAISDGDTAITLDGTGSEYGEVAHAAWMDSASVTLECWIKTTAASGVAIGRAGAGEPFIGTLSNKAYFQILASGTITKFAWDETGLLVNDDEWHHIVGTYDAALGEMAIFVDGDHKDTNTEPSGDLAVNASALRVGRRGTSPSALPFTGSIDEVAVYGTALSPTRIAAHYSAAAPVGTLSLSDTLPALVDSLTFRSYTRTDTSNGRSGRIRGGYAIHADNTDPVTLPAAAATRRDKALWYPEPELVDGRPVSPPPVSESSVIPQTIPFTIGAS